MKEKKGKLARAFDEGLLEELLKKEPQLLDEPEVAEYSRSLQQLEDSLQHPPRVDVPRGFTAAVMKHLPDLDLREIKIINMRDIILPIIVGSAIILSFIFSDFLGISKLLNNSSTLLKSVEGSDMRVLFLAVSSAGILGATWLVISSFFGVRSRRITDYRYK